MATKTIVRNPDGTPVRNERDGSIRFTYLWDEDETAKLSAGTHVQFVTGPMTGYIELPDGTIYDVTEEQIVVPLEHTRPLQLAIHAADHRAGNFLDSPLPTE